MDDDPSKQGAVGSEEGAGSRGRGGRGEGGQGGEGSRGRMADSGCSGGREDFMVVSFAEGEGEV